MNNPSPHNTKSQMRKRIRALRKSLSPQQQLTAMVDLAKSARHCRPIWFAKRIISYAPFEGEISPFKLLETLSPAQIYLPQISNYRTRSMQFVKAPSKGSLRKGIVNKFGISEPKHGHAGIFANQADVILLPLVAFDRNGNRLGMGAGYYDRALSSLTYQTGSRPILIGLSHHFQEMPFLNAKPWDVPLDGILTDREYIKINSNK